MRTTRKTLTTIVSIILTSTIIFNISSILWSQKEIYLSHDYWQRFPKMEKDYLNSQYVSKHPAGWIVDQAAFSYAAGKLITGTNPVLVLIDAPPLGKYLIGLSAVIFNNEHIITGMFGILSIGMLYLLSNQILRNKSLALLPAVLFSSETAFKNQFIYTPLMDLFQLFFILTYFYFINKAFLPRHSPGLASSFYIKARQPVFFILASIFLGFFISTKFYVSGLSIIAASILWTILHKDIKKALGVIFTLPISIGILLLNYARVFAFDYTFREFLGIQKYIFLYHQSQIILPFSVWPLLLFNRWYVWFGDKPIISDGQWAITWPIITIISFITMALYILKKIPRVPEIEIIMLWSICYLLFLSTGQTFSRYLIILLPIFYIISIYGATSVAVSLQYKRTHKK